MNKRIVFIMSSMGRGGAERVVSILSREYCALGWAVDICMLLHNIIEYDLDKRVRVIDLSFDHEPKARRTVKMLLSLRKYIRDNKPQVVVPFLAKTSALHYVATFGTKRRNYRMVTSERIDPYSAHYSKPLRGLVKLAYKKADAVVFQTRRAKTFYSIDIQRKGVIIGNPVAMQYTKAAAPNPVIINAGRLETQKNQKILINAFARIASKYPDYQMHIYGEGSLRKALETQISKLGMAERIILKGNCPDYLEKLARSEMFVLSSDYEGMSNALLEAMALSMPCVSTECAGSDEIIVNGENGLLTPVGDAGKLAEAMDRLLSDSALCARLGGNAGQTARQFATENIISSWRKALEGEK